MAENNRSLRKRLMNRRMKNMAEARDNLKNEIKNDGVVRCLVTQREQLLERDMWYYNEILKKNKITRNMEDIQCKLKNHNDVNEEIINDLIVERDEMLQMEEMYYGEVIVYCGEITESDVLVESMEDEQRKLRMEIENLKKIWKS